MAALSSYPQVTSLLGAHRVPLVTNPGVAGGNGWISAADLSTSVRAAASSLRPTGTIAESAPRHAVTSVTSITTGRLFLVALPLTAGQVVNSLSFYAGSSDMATQTHWWFALYDSGLALIRQTADQLTAAWLANTKKTLALSSSYTVPTTGLYYAGICAVASGFSLASTGPSGILASVVNEPPILSGGSTSSLVATAPPTAAALTPSSYLYYATAS